MKMRERLLLNPAVAAEKHDRSHEDDAQVERQRGVADLPMQLLFVRRQQCPRI
jgi:hypothetical protein